MKYIKSVNYNDYLRDKKFNNLYEFSAPIAAPIGIKANCIYYEVIQFINPLISIL